MAYSDSVTVKFNTVDAGVDGTSTIGAALLLGLLMAERLAWCVCEGGRGGGEKVRIVRKVLHGNREAQHKAQHNAQLWSVGECVCEGRREEGEEVR